MNIFYVFAGMFAGAIATWLVTYFFLKSRMIPKEEYDKNLDSLYQVRTEQEVEKLKNSQLQEELKKHQEELSIQKEEQMNLNSWLASCRAGFEASKKQITQLNEEKKQVKEELTRKVEEFHEANKKLAEYSAENRSLQEKLEVQKKEIEELGKKFNTEFENIANKILDEKAHKFTVQNKDNLETILKPFGDNIDKFKKKVEEVYDKEAQQRFSLGKEVEKLVKLNQRVSEEANNLTKALKGNTKTQGDWGQMILENILEQSGLVKGREYFVQEYLKDEDGNYLKNEYEKKMQPDVIINYPDDRKVIIDSKVSLTAYTRFVESEDTDVQKKAIQDHLRSVKKHIDELSVKSYQDFSHGLDFVMMFVPNEPAWMLALQHEPDIWHYAYEKKIIFISPTNLIAALKMIADLWKRENQSRNAQAIAERGAALYDKFVGFVDNLSKVGEHLGKTQKSFDSAFSQLKDGSGNLIGQAEKLRALGLKTKKKLPVNLTDQSIGEQKREDE